jgi:hypothetical protein
MKLLAMVESPASIAEARRDEMSAILDTEGDWGPAGVDCSSGGPVRGQTQ